MAVNPGRPLKLLVLAQTPPPLHGQSAMVKAMLDGLTPPAFELHHVNLSLSRDNADIGRWRPGKFFTTLRSALQAAVARWRFGCTALYYVPAPPARRGALYRDWTILALCRPFFPHLILHWHAAGLAGWLQRDATALERVVTRWLLGRAHLSLVLAPSLRDDADWFHSRRIEVVPNGVSDPIAAPMLRPRANRAPWQCLFLGLCSEEKGLFAAAAAVIAANERTGATPARPHFTLIAAGPFADEGSAARFQQMATQHPTALRHAGFVVGEAKSQLFASSHCLLFPTHYPAEALPLVVLEALAHDLPIVGTAWRALPDIVPASCGRLVPVNDVDALASALVAMRDSPPPAGMCRTHYLAHYTLPQHLEQLAGALLSIREAAPHASARA